MYLKVSESPAYVKFNSYFKNKSTYWEIVTFPNIILWQISRGKNVVKIMSLANILKVKKIRLLFSSWFYFFYKSKVERFIQFQRELEQMGKLVEMLPFDENSTDAFLGNQTVTDSSVPNTSSSQHDPPDSKVSA